MNFSNIWWVFIFTLGAASPEILGVANAQFLPLILINPWIMNQLFLRIHEISLKLPTDQYVSSYLVRKKKMGA